MLPKKKLTGWLPTKTGFGTGVVGLWFAKLQGLKTCGRFVVPQTAGFRKVWSGLWFPKPQSSKSCVVWIVVPRTAGFKQFAVPVCGSPNRRA